MGEHAALSPSGAHRWMRCPGSLLLEQQYPDSSSVHASEGTAAHTLASNALLSERPASSYIGDVITADGIDFVVTKDMAAYIDDYIRLVRQYAEGGTLLVEERVDFSPVVDVPDSYGTSDAIIVLDDTITVVDLKYGMGVRVDATENEQLMLYALGALEGFGLLGDFAYVVMVIHQPRLNHVSEWAVPVDVLRTFGVRAKLAASAALQADAELVTGDKQCRFCRAKSGCPALKADVTTAVGHVSKAADFADLVERSSDELSTAMGKVELIEQWCLSIRAEVERRLLAGVGVPGYKIVEGRKGNRAWASETDAEFLLKSFYLAPDEMYDRKLISPTKAEKLLKSSPERWSKVEALITRGDGKPSVAPATDKRSALTVSTVADGLRELSAN
jgi:hypothetical protein